MITLIQDAVYMANPMDLCLQKEEASEILEKIEKAGMLPPIRVTKDLPFCDYSWEPECEAPKCCGEGCNEQNNR